MLQLPQIPILPSSFTIEEAKAAHSNLINEANSPTSSKGWALDPDAFERACVALGLVVRPQLRHDHWGWGAVGALNVYTTPPDRWEIQIRSALSPEAASMVLWHELVHARQAQDYGNPYEFNKVVEQTGYVAEMSDRYFGHPIELQAYSSSKVANTIQMCRPPERRLAPDYLRPESMSVTMKFDPIDFTVFRDITYGTVRDGF